MLSAVQGIWPLIERGQATEAMAELVSAFGELPELAGDGGSLVRLFHGQPAEMRTAALPLLPEMLENLPVDKEWLPNLAGVVGGFWQQGIGGDPARLLYDVLTPWADLFLVDGIGAAFIGSVELVLGELATLLEEYDAAAGHLARALERNATIGAALPVANVQRVARRACSSDEADRATTSSAVGCSPRHSPSTGAPGSRSAWPSSRRRSVLSTPRRSRMRLASSAATGRSGRSRGADARRPCPPSRGWPTSPYSSRSRTARRTCSTSSAPPRAPRSDLGEVIDAPAREAYRTRLAELDERLADAEAAGDADASEQAASEREFLLAELGRRTASAGVPAVRVTRPSAPAPR